MILHAIRHAPTASAPGPVGRRDVAIVGSHEAAAAAALRVLPPDARPGRVWSSPLLRCAQTASLVAGRLEIVHTIDERLLEIAYGAWEGRAWAELQRAEAFAYAHWLERWETSGPPGGESARELEGRVRAWLGTLDDASHLLIAHAGVVRALHVICRGLTWSEAMATAVPHLGTPGALVEFSA